MAIMLIMCIAAVFLTYELARSISDRRTGLYASGLLALASPWSVYSQVLFCEILVGLLLIGATHFVLRKNAIASAIFSMVAIWLKPPFVAFSIGWIAYFLWKKEYRAALGYLIITTVGGVALMVFNLHMSRTPFVSGAEGLVLANGLHSAIGTLFNLGNGLLVFVPWLWLLPFLLYQKRNSGTIMSFAAVVLIPLPLYWMILSIHRSLGGWCYGPRYWIPVLPALSILSVAIVLASARRTKIIFTMLVLMAIAIVFPAQLLSNRVWNMSPHVSYKILYHKLARGRLEV